MILYADVDNLVSIKVLIIPSINMILCIDVEILDSLSTHHTTDNTLQNDLSTGAFVSSSARYYVSSINGLF